MRIVSLVFCSWWFGIPSVFYGDALGLDRLSVILWVTVGAMAGVTFNLLLADWIADRLRRRAAAKGEVSRVEKIAARAEPLVERSGLVGLGLIGPVVLGTFGTALVAPVLGLPRRRAFISLLIGVTAWCTVLGVGADLLVDQFGIDPE